MKIALQSDDLGVSAVTVARIYWKRLWNYTGLEQPRKAVLFIYGSICGLILMYMCVILQKYYSTLLLPNLPDLPLMTFIYLQKFTLGR